MPARERWRLIATGRVQGVGYRARVVETADRLGIVGWVSNRPDGTVEIEAEGDPRRLEHFRERISGPRGASHAHTVTRVAELPLDPGSRDFHIV